MEPLFTTKTTYTLDEYMRYCIQISLKGKRFIRTMILFMAAVMILVVLCFLTNSDSIGFGFLVGGLLCPFIITFNFRRSVKRTFNSNALIRDAECTISFYEAHMAGDDPAGHAEYTYDKLHSIIETKTNFYLMIAENQGSVVVKDNCTPELIKFIQELKRKYNK